jgi:hypothetical protein
MKTTIKLFIFEPYEWPYCGGSIGVIARSFNQAVDVIIKMDKDQAKRKLEIQSGLASVKRSVDDYRTFSREHFSRTTKGFVEDHCDQWLLTSELTIIEDGRPNPRVLFNNWNYA